MKNKFLLLAYVMFIGIFFSCKEKLETPELRADFSADVQAVKAGNAVTFADISGGSAARWNWTFEGGTPETSNLSSPTVIYNQPGTYAVSLTLNNGSASSTLTKETFITVSFNEIAAAFEADKTTVRQGESVVFNDLSTGMPATWLWEFIPPSGQALTSSQQNPAMTFTEPGVYRVKLRASNPEYSDQVIKENYLTVIDITSVSAAFSSNQTGTYAGGAVSFTDASVGTATAWAWTFEGGSPATSTQQNPTVTYHTPGRYKVTLVASNPAKSSTIEQEDYVVVVPGAGLVAFFPFSGTINDVGPNKVAANQVGTITFTGADRKGLEGNTAVFDGSSAIVVPDHDAFNFDTDDYTIAAWLKTGLTKKMFIWMESGKKGSRDNQAWMRIGNNTTSQLVQFATEDAAGGSFISIGTEGKVSDNSWHHVVCVREGVTTRVYIDGVLVKSATTAAVKDISNEGNFSIGVQDGSGGYGSFFTGQLDDITVYRKALSATEVAELYNL